MDKFKVGDKVRILDGSNIENYAGGWTPSMRHYVGKVSTIKAIKNQYHDLGIDGGGYAYDERGLELVDDKSNFDKDKAKEEHEQVKQLNESIADTIKFSPLERKIEIKDNAVSIEKGRIVELVQDLIINDEKIKKLCEVSLMDCAFTMISLDIEKKLFEGNRTVLIQKDKIHNIMLDLINNDDNYKELTHNNPLLIVVFGILAAQITEKIFGKDEKDE